MEFQKEFPTCLLHTLKEFSCHTKTCTTGRNPNCQADVEELRTFRRRQTRGGCWKRPGQVRSWTVKLMPSHSDRIRLHSKHGDSVSCKRPSFNDPKSGLRYSSCLAPYPSPSFCPYSSLSATNLGGSPHMLIWPGLCVGHSMARLRGRHPAPSAPARRAGIEASPVPKLVSELQNREDAVELWLP